MKMNKKVLLAALVVLAPATAMAAGENNVGSCGWGSKLFEGQKGVAPQVLAVTTNGTSGNQTFGVTSGTSGCTQDGTVRSNWKAQLFTSENQENLARDVAMGQGETLDSFAQILGVSAADKPEFFRVTHDNFGRIFTSAHESSNAILASMKQVLAENPRLAVYSSRI